MRILILEDNPIIGLDLKDIVETCGHRVVKLCGTLAEFRSCLSDEPADFALLDVDLPDGKSYGLAAKLTERRIPFAFLSGSRPSEMPEALRHVPFIPKPYAVAAIRRTLETDDRIAC